MRTARAAILVTQAVLVGVFIAALVSRTTPLGVRGEWEWRRLPETLRPPWFGVLFAGAALGAYVGFIAAGQRALRGQPSRLREAVWLVVLPVAGLAVQAVVPCGAPAGYDLSRWAFVPYFAGSTGYYQVAKRQVGDPWRFLADYPDWIRRQDALHIGTHPPGMVMLEYGLVRGMETHPGTAKWVVGHLPAAIRDGFQFVGPGSHVPFPDRAALALTSALAWLACGATVVPLYLLARVHLPPPPAWAAAALWPLVPATILFQPLADTAFPLLATTALALACGAARAGRGWGWLGAFGAGVVLASGAVFSLVFFPVGLAVGLTLGAAPGAPWKRRALLIGATGVGFLAVTLLSWWVTRADPFVIWWWNQENHARFYVEYPRTYRAWVLVNPVELAVALGLPAAVWAVAGLARPRELPRAVWATLAVLAFLNFTGKNLSEVARLWLPLMPPLLVAAAVGLSKLGGGPKALALSAALLGAETLALQAAIQVVYPVEG